MTDISEAILLVGGRGTRLSSVVSDRPKPLAEVAGKPFAEWLILQLRTQGVRRFVLASGHLSQHIQEYFDDGRRWGVELIHVVEAQPLGTGGAARYAAEQITGQSCFVLNGDSYCTADLLSLARFHYQTHARATLALKGLPDCSRYGTVELAPDGQIARFREKTHEAGAGLINAGVYCFEREALLSLPAGQSLSLEKDVFERWTGVGLFGLPSDGAFLDIGTPESYAQAESYLQTEFSKLDIPREILDKTDYVRSYFQASNQLKQRVAQNCAPAIQQAAQLINQAFANGHKLLLCGNGGSAADAQHIAAEFVSLLTQKFKRPGLPAIALTTDTSMLTAYSNDFGFEGVFARQVGALGLAGDVLFGISTSGNSKNVIAALHAAQVRGLATISLHGANGQLESLAQCAITIPSTHTQHIQESMLAVEHLICELVEAELFGRVLNP